MQTFKHQERKQIHNWQHERWMLVGGDGTIEGQLFARVALISVRTLNTVGGIRNDRGYARRKTHLGQDHFLNAMKVFAAAAEIAKRRARNKSATQSRRINRARQG